MHTFYSVYKERKKMKLFISWSGEKSLAVAKVLKEWIPCVIQDVQPYFSSDDIDKGARWSTDIAKELEEATFGILCVTKDNLNSQWLNFEAGALSKAIDKSKVCPFLLDLKATDITDSPILQFQMANTEKDDMYKLFKSINKHIDNGKLEETRLEKLFNAFWPDINKELDKIKEKNINTKATNETDNQDKYLILEEMLDLLRSQHRILKDPEQIVPIKHLQSALSRRDKLFYRNDRILKRMEYYENNIREILDKGLNEEYFSELTFSINAYIDTVHRFRMESNGLD